MAYRANVIDDSKNQIRMITNFNMNSDKDGIFTLDNFSTKLRNVIVDGETNTVQGIRLDFTINIDDLMNNADITPIGWNETYDVEFNIAARAPAPIDNKYFIDPYFKVSEGSDNFNLMLLYQVFIYDGTVITPSTEPIGYSPLTYIRLTVNKDDYSFSSNYSSLFKMDGTFGVSPGSNLSTPYKSILKINGFGYLVSRNEN